jgi:hypothetical protein
VGRGRRGEHLHACRGGGLSPAAVRSIPARSNQMAISGNQWWQSGAESAHHYRRKASSAIARALRTTSS